MNINLEKACEGSALSLFLACFSSPILKSTCDDYVATAGQPSFEYFSHFKRFFLMLVYYGATVLRIVSQMSSIATQYAKNS